MVWAPKEKFLWDVWFTRDRAENLHVFYLQADKKDCGFDPARRHDLATVGHAELLGTTWTSVLNEPAFCASEDGWDNISIWTGSIIFDATADLFYMFYTSRNRFEKLLWTPRGEFPPQQIGIAVSEDLLKWTRLENTRKGPQVLNPAPALGLDGVNWRDPYVSSIDSTYHCLVSTRLSPGKDVSDDAGGTIALLSSQHLLEWKSAETKILADWGDFYQMEVPQIFCRNYENRKRYYLIFCAQAADCSQKRRIEQSPLNCQTGTYCITSHELPADSTEIPYFNGTARLLARDLYAGKLIEHEGETVLFGFDYQGEEASFKGGVSGPHKVFFSIEGDPQILADMK